ncbi:hypothetical protein FRC17_001785 [Serendipita sp. 399]|nr:hypothetical protein FRC17_001785 [Serendipita sp. 399]
MVNERHNQLEEQLKAETASRKAMAEEYDGVYQNFLRNAHARIALSQKALRTDDALKRLSEENQLLHEELALSDELRRQLRKVLRFTTCQLVKFSKLSNSVLTDWCDMESDFHELKKHYKVLLRSYEEATSLRPSRTVAEKQAEEAEQRMLDKTMAERTELVIQTWEEGLVVPRLIVPPEWSGIQPPGPTSQDESTPKPKTVPHSTASINADQPEAPNNLQTNASSSTSSNRITPTVLKGPLPRGYPSVNAVRKLLRPRKLPVPGPGAEDAVRLDVPAFKGVVPMKSWLNHNEKEAQMASRGALAPKLLPFPREVAKATNGAPNCRSRAPEPDRKGKGRANPMHESDEEEEETDIEEEIRQFRSTLDQKEQGWTCEEMDHIRFGVDRINTLYENRAESLARLVDPDTPENRERLRRIRGEQRDVARVLEEEEGLDFRDLPFPMPEPRFQHLGTAPMTVTRLHDVKLELPEPEIDDPTSTTRPWVRLYQEDVNDPRRQLYWGHDNPYDPVPEESPDELDSNVIGDGRQSQRDNWTPRETSRIRKYKRGERSLEYIEEEDLSDLESEEETIRTKKKRRTNAIQLRDDAPYQEQITDDGLRTRKKTAPTAGPSADIPPINRRKRSVVKGTKQVPSETRMTSKAGSKARQPTQEIIVPAAVAAVFADRDVSDRDNQGPKQARKPKSTPANTSNGSIAETGTIAPVRRSQRQTQQPSLKPSQSRR